MKNRKVFIISPIMELHYVGLCHEDDEMDLERCGAGAYIDSMGWDSEKCMILTLEEVRRLLDVSDDLIKNIQY